MKAKTDYHVHPDYSLDADPVKITDYCYRALKLGLKEICFTTHLEYGPVDRGENKSIYYKGERYSIFEYEWLESYLEEIDRAVQEYKSHGLSIKTGLEIGYNAKYIKNIEKIVEQYPFDYILGAIHYLNNYCISSKDESQMYFTKKSLKEIKRDYFNMLTEMIKTGLFDAVAHLDIYTRYGIRQFGEKIKTIHRGIIEPVLKEIASRHMALEINTSSISRGLKEFHPSREIISLAKRAGVMVFTVGSDAHKLAGLGEHINEALLLLDEFNLNNHVYTNHKACPLP